MGNPQTLGLLALPVQISRITRTDGSFRKPLGRDNAQDDASRHAEHAHANGFMQEHRRQCQSEEGLQQLELTDCGDASLGESSIPKDKSDKHAEKGNIPKAKPCGCANRDEGGGR